MNHGIACFRNNFKKLVESLTGKAQSSRDFRNNIVPYSGCYNGGI
jgi:hypothetical protein